MNTRQTRTRIWFFAAVASLIALPAWADGELDTSFGTNGIVKIAIPDTVAFPDTSVGYLRDLAIVNGVIEAAGFDDGGGCTTQPPSLIIVKLSLAGSVIGTPGSYPLPLQCPTGLRIDPATGDIYVIGWGASHTTVQRFDASGSVLGTYGVGAGNSGSSGTIIACRAGRPLIDNQSRFVVPCTFTPYRLFSKPQPSKIALLRLSALDGQLIGGFLALSPAGHIFGPSVIAQDESSGAYYVDAPLMRLSADSGSLDTAYGSGGWGATSGSGQAITLDDLGNVLIASGGHVARVDPAGTLVDASFGTNGVTQDLGQSIVDLHTDKSGLIYGLGAQLLRLKANGARDTSFGSSSDVQALNGPGSIWASMQFTDSSHSSAYLLGGVGGCNSTYYSCSNLATTAVIAKVTLVSSVAAPGMTVTVLNTSSTTVASGQPVTLTATVTGTHPTGSVTFKDGSTTLGTANLTASNNTTYTTSGLGVGDHYLTADYAGDGNNVTSTSQSVLETVQGVSTTVLRASATTITSGDSVTFTATVNGPNPVGTVSFFTNPNTLPGDPVALTSGTATYTTSALPVGSWSVYAGYNGDSHNLGSTSSAVTVTVDATAAGSGGGPSGDPPGSGGQGGGGAFTLVDLCGALLLGVWRALRRLPLEGCKQVA